MPYCLGVRSLLLVMVLPLAGCPTSEPSAPLDTAVWIAGALLDADGVEAPFEAEASGHFDSCREGCGYLQLDFPLGESDLSSQWTFASSEPGSAGASPLTYVSLLWDDRDAFGRQGEGPTSWGELPGGDVVVEDTCDGRCVSGFLDGAASVTVYDGWNELPSGEVLRVDTLRFDELPHAPGLALH